jgi:hypothetical protein
MVGWYPWQRSKFGFVQEEGSNRAKKCDLMGVLLEAREHAALAEGDASLDLPLTA